MLCPCYFTVAVLILCFSKRWEGRLTKVGSLAPCTREKFSVNFRGVTTTYFHYLVSLMKIIHYLIDVAYLLGTFDHGKQKKTF